MTFLAPWALALGGGGAIGIVLLHLVSRHRPAAFTLPTTRFIPDEQTLVSRAATRPRDLLLLLLRVLLLVSVATAFAKPVLSPTSGSVGRIILADRSRAVADSAEVSGKVRELSTGVTEAIVIEFDSSARAISSDARQEPPLPEAHPEERDRRRAPGDSRGSISAALLVAHQTATSFADRVDSIQLVLVSPVAAGELDSATRTLRAMWPAGIQVERVALRTDSAITWSLDAPVNVSHPLGPATFALRGPRKTRLVRSLPTPADSAFASGGGTVVRWDPAGSARPSAEGLSVDGDVIVAAVVRRPVANAGTTIARWADGAPAATETGVGSGCIREVGVGIPPAGDLALHPPFQRIVRRLLAPCGVREPDGLADSAAISMIRGPDGRAAVSSELRNTDYRVSRFAQWLLGLALVFALAELFMRRTAPPQEPA